MIFIHYCGSHNRGGRCESSNWIVEYAEDHPEESAVNVYVDPENPERSVLKNGLDFSNISASEFYAIVIVILDLFALLAIFGFVKRKINKLKGWKKLSQ